MRHKQQKSGSARVFDRFAEAASDFASHTTFFVGCVALVVIWVPSYFVFGSIDTWQLVINTATTIVTFLMVAILQNSQRRSDVAMHEKLDALADGLADLMQHVAAVTAPSNPIRTSFAQPWASRSPGKLAHPVPIDHKKARAWNSTEAWFVQDA
jgi:hypothetical protein